MRCIQGRGGNVKARCGEEKEHGNGVWEEVKGKRQQDRAKAREVARGTGRKWEGEVRGGEEEVI